MLMLTLDHSRQLAKKFHLDLVVIFGSHASGKLWKHSDLDIAVMGKNPLEPEQWDSAMIQIMRLSKCNKVDLIDLKRQRGVLLNFQIMTKGKCLYEYQKGFFREKQMEAIWKYWDFKPMLADSDRALDYQLTFLEHAR